MPRLEELILYILANYNNRQLTETKLHKLLYYCDFNHYEKTRKAITEGTYMNNNFGPTLRELGIILNGMESKGMIKKIQEKNIFGSPQTRYSIISDELVFDFNAETMEIIKQVNEDFRNLKPIQISAMSHFDSPFLLSESGQDLKYEDVLHRDDEFVVPEEEREGWKGFLSKEEIEKLVRLSGE